MDVVCEGLVKKLALQGSDPSNIMSQCVLFKRVCIKFIPLGTHSAQKYFAFVPFTFHRASVSFVICKIWLLSVPFGVMLSSFCLFGRCIWDFHLTETFFSGFITNHERSTCTQQDKRMAS